jgi:hypothetical protein
MGYIIRLIVLFVFLVPYNTIHIAATLVQSTLHLNDITTHVSHSSRFSIWTTAGQIPLKAPPTFIILGCCQEQEYFPVRYNPVLKAAPLEQWLCIERLIAYVPLQYTCICPLDAEKSDPQDSVLISSLPSSSSGRDSPSL